MPFTTRITVVDCAGARTCEGVSLDLSTMGAKFYSAIFYPPGTRVSVSFWLAGGGAAELEATVRWAEVEQDGAIMGAEFDVPLSGSHCPRLYDALFANV